MIQVETIAQYKIINYIQKHFNIEDIQLEIAGPDRIKITDKNKESMTFSINLNNDILDADTWEVLGK